MLYRVPRSFTIYIVSAEFQGEPLNVYTTASFEYIPIHNVDRMSCTTPLKVKKVEESGKEENDERRSNGGKETMCIKGRGGGLERYSVDI